MDACTIDILASKDPGSSLIAPPLALILRDRRWAPLHNQAKDRYLSLYARPGFGHYIALQFANRRMPFPLILQGRDMWVYRDYLMTLDPWEHHDPHIADAYHLADQLDEAPELNQGLKALMLAYEGLTTPEKHLEFIHQRTHIPYETLDAFEVLFFNVLDRHRDSFYLAREVYPETRLPEFDENYLENSKHSDLIKRVAYNHKDLELTAYLAGLGDHTFLRKVSAGEDRESDMTRYLMGNGLVLVQAGLVNQRSAGMSRVSHLLAASRQGGKEQEEPTVSGIAPLFSDALKIAVDANKNVVWAQQRIDAGFIEASEESIEVQAEQIES